MRYATTQENGFNRKINLNNTCGVKGVSLHKTSEKWRAQVYIVKKQVTIGYLDTLGEEPKQARQDKV